MKTKWTVAITYFENIIHPNILVEAEGNTVEEALQDAWCKLQRHEGPNPILDLIESRSAMVGDGLTIFVDSVIEHYIIDSVGFKKVTDEFWHKWAKMPIHLRTLGVGIATKHGLRNTTLASPQPVSNAEILRRVSRGEGKFLPNNE